MHVCHPLTQQLQLYSSYFCLETLLLEGDLSRKDNKNVRDVLREQSKKCSLSTPFTGLAPSERTQKYGIAPYVCRTSLSEERTK